MGSLQLFQKLAAVGIGQLFIELSEPLHDGLISALDAVVLATDLLRVLEQEDIPHRAGDQIDLVNDFASHDGIRVFVVDDIAHALVKLGQTVDADHCHQHHNQHQQTKAQ